MVGLSDAEPVHLYVCLKPMSPAPTITQRLAPPEAEHSNPHAQPIWGEFVRMVTQGGERRGKPTKYRYLAKSSRVWLGPDGTYHSAADPQVSNDDIVMSISRAMYWCGWTLDQVRTVMTDPDNKGCQAWRDAMQLQRDPEAWEQRLWRNIIENDWRRLPCGMVKTKPKYERKMPTSRRLAELLQWIALHPEENQAALLKSGRLRSRQRWVLDALEAEGKIFHVWEDRANARGSIRPQKFWRLADSNAEDVQAAREFAQGRKAYLAANRFTVKHTPTDRDPDLDDALASCGSPDSTRLGRHDHHDVA